MSEIKQKNRAQLKHTLRDIGMKDKPKILDLEAEFGPLARLLFSDLLDAMSGASMGRISRSTARMLGKRIGFNPKATHDIVEYCLTKQMLLLEGELLTNSRVIKDQEALYKTQERWRESKRKGKGIPPDSTGNPQGTIEESARKSEHLKIEELKIEDLKKNGAGFCTSQITLSKDQFNSLVMNECHGDEEYLIEQINLATHNRNSRKEDPPKESMSYMKSWLARERVDYSKRARASPEKLTSAEKILQMGREIEEEDNVATRNNKTISDN